MIVHAAQFDASGRYVFFGTVDDAFPGLFGPSMLYFGDVDIATHYHDLATNTPVAMPERPSEHHQFDYATKQWQDPRSLQDLRTAQWAQIKSDRAAAIAAPLATPYGIFDADAAARTSITDAVLMLQTIGPTGSIDFTLADNSTTTLTTAQMVEVGLLLGAQVQAAHAQARILRSQIEAATTPAQITAITWTTA